MAGNGSGSADADNIHVEISEWWPKLSDRSRQWLIDQNGEAVPPEIVGPTGLYLLDRAINWVEEAANEEA